MDESVESIKTPEQMKAEKFASNPEKFIDIDNVIMAVVKNDKSVATYHGACTRVDMEIALTRLTYKTFQIMQMMDIASAQKEAQNIITPHNSPIEFARNGLHK